MDSAWNGGIVPITYTTWALPERGICKRDDRHLACHVAPTYVRSKLLLAGPMFGMQRERRLIGHTRKPKMRTTTASRRTLQDVVGARRAPKRGGLGRPPYDADLWEDSSDE